MTLSRAKANTLIDCFLHVLDKFGITSWEECEYNYLSNDDLTEYWVSKGVIRNDKE